MYNITSQLVNQAIMSDARTFRALLDFGTFTISGADVGRATTEHTISDDDSISIGEVISRRAEINIYSRKTVRKGDVFRLFLYLLDYGASGSAAHAALRQWTHRELSMFTHAQIKSLSATKDADGAPLDGVLIPMGEYVVRRVQIHGTSTTITAYDKLSAADQIYAPTIAFPADSGTVTDDVLRQLGITSRTIAGGGYLLTSDSGELLTSDAGELLISAEYSFTIDGIPDGMTCREVLGAISAVYGGNAILDRNGNFTTAFMSISGSQYDQNKVDGPEIADADVKLSGIRCILSGDEALTVGDPEGAYAIECTCPWMTQERLNTIWKRLRNFRWRPASLHERLADPRRDMGDLKYYKDARGKFSIPVTGLIFHFDGGLSADVTAAGSGVSPQT